MLRRVESSFTAVVREPAEVELQVAVAAPPREELLEVTLDGRPLPVTEHRTTAGGRLHLCTARPGELAVRYRATVGGGAGPVPVEPLDASTYLRPSRYAESDRLGAVARAELGRLPQAGDVLERLGHRFAVTELDGRRVARIRLTTVPDPGEPDPGKPDPGKPDAGGAPGPDAGRD